MEFYELNRLYDENLGSMDLSKSVDNCLFIIMPVVISFGCGISFINMFILSRTKRTTKALSTSRQYFYSQSICNFLLQLVSSIIFITNYYEKYLINQLFANEKQFYLNLKIVLNLLYNILLYCVIWLFTISTLDFCVSSIIKYQLNSNFNRDYTSNFYRQQSLFNYQQKLLKKKLENMHFRQNSVRMVANKNSTNNINKYLHQKQNHAKQANQTYNGGLDLIMSGDSVEKRFLSASSSDNSLFVNNQNIDDVTMAQSVNILNDNLADTNLSTDHQKQNSRFKESDISEIVFIDDHENKKKQIKVDLNLNDLNQTNNYTTSSQPEAHQNDYEEFEEEYFCKPTTIRSSILAIAVLSFLLASPQIFAYDIGQNRISISPSPQPQANFLAQMNSDTRLFENVVFISKDDSYDFKNQDFILNNKLIKDNKRRKPVDLRYSINIAKAYAMSIKFDQDAHSRSVLDSMRKTHMKFFTSNGFFHLASSNYNWCHMIRNLDPRSLTTTKKMSTISTTYSYSSQSNDKFMTPIPTTTVPQIAIVNLTLYCIKKSDLNTYLAYNTLYFWLEHTMTISVPISIVLVVFVSICFTCTKYSKLISRQNRVRQKRYKLSKLKYQNTLNYRYNCLNKNTSNHNTNALFEPKVVQVRQKLNSVDVVTTSLNDYLSSSNANENVELGDLELDSDENEFKESDIERKICDKQYLDQDLNKLFLVDLFLYMMLSFPYTLLRLVLDLFVKDQIKISLDFFILYKFSLLTFHVHLILKFFLLILFNQKFRSCLARSLAIQNSKCCQNLNNNNNNNNNTNTNFDYNRRDKYAKLNNNNNNINNKNKLTRCCLGHKTLIKSQNSSQSIQNQHDWYASYYDHDNDDIKYHSIEFNSNYHQYLCPADPDQENIDFVLNNAGLMSNNKNSDLIIDNKVKLTSYN